MSEHKIVKPFNQYDNIIVTRFLVKSRKHGAKGQEK